MSDLTRVEQVFQAAIDLTPEARRGYLDDACGHDPSLRDRVERLIAEHEGQTMGVLAWSPVGETEGEPTQIGPYKITGVLGEGGMGRVYEAEQQSPRRSVALKVIRDGFGTAEGQRRFAREAELLAQLKHPGIAQVFESGTAPDDRGLRRRYLAMELVRGQPLLLHAKSASLALPERIELLARVADAVQHAHQRGVIHRDLKSANILVERIGDDRIGQPKVLDFGVARLSDDTGAVHTLATEPGRIIGTLAYMSPEQLEGNTRLVDTRTDVYAIGSLGYELLGGAAPLLVTEKSLPEAARIIRDVEPPRLGDTARACRGDIETIIRKAMEKDRDRRYAGAGELAADLRRFLRFEPITARPPTTMYQLRKLARRNRALVGGSALALAALIIGLAVALVALARAERQRVEAEQASARYKQVARVLTDVFAGINPEASRGRDVSVLRETLERVESHLGTDLKDQPETEAELRVVLGDAYRNLWKPDHAEANYNRAIELFVHTGGPDSPALPRVLNRLALICLDQDRLDDAEAALKRATAIIDRTPTDSAEEDVNANVHLGNVYRAKDRLPDAEAAFRSALARAKSLHGEQSAMYAMVLASLANAVDEQGRYDEAGVMLNQAITISTQVSGELHPETAMMIDNLSGVLYRQEKLPEAEAAAKKALDLHSQLVPGDSEPTASSLTRLASAESNLGKTAEAILHAREAVEMHERVLGRLNHTVSGGLTNLGHLLADAGRNDEAVEMGRKALEIDNQLFPPPSSRVLVDLMMITRALNRAGKLAELEEPARQTIDIAGKIFPGDHPTRLVAELNGATILGEVAWLQRTDPQASLELSDYLRATLEDAIPRAAAKRGENDPLVLRAKLCLASCGVFRAAALLASGAPPPEVIALLETALPACTSAQEALFADDLPIPESIKRGFRLAACTQMARLHEVWATAAPGGEHEGQMKHWNDLADTFVSPPRKP